MSSSRRDRSTESTARSDVDVGATESVDVEPYPDSATLLRRLHLVEGQVAGLVRMVEAGRPHRDVIIQVSAATHALHRIGFLLVAEEMRNGDLTDESAAAARRIAALEKLFMSLA